MIVVTGYRVDVNSHARMERKGAQKLPDALGAEVADLLSSKFKVEREHSAPGNIDGDQNQGFVHRCMVARVPLNGLPREGLSKSSTEHDSRVFDRVMVINVQVAFYRKPEIKVTMKGKLLEHMVKEADPGGNVASGSAIQIQHRMNRGFGGFTIHLGKADGWGALAHGFIVTRSFLKEELNRDHDEEYGKSFAQRYWVHLERNLRSKKRAKEEARGDQAPCLPVHLIFTRII